MKNLVTNIFKVIFTQPNTAEKHISVNQDKSEYPRTIFLWYFSKRPSKVLKNSDYPKYLTHECGIQDPSEYHKQLIQEGFFIETTNEEKLNMKKVSELKEILAILGLDIAGKKNTLIQRILNNASDEILRTFTPSNLYSISNIGRALIDKNNDYIKLHQHSQLEISYMEYDIEHQKGWSFYDTVWRILNKRIIHEQNDYGRHQYVQMYHLLDEEGNKTGAMNILLRILLIDLSGEKDYLIGFAPRIISEIAIHGDVFSESMIDRLYQGILPKKACNKELFSQIVHTLIDGSFDETKALTEIKKYRRKPKKVKETNS